MPWRQIQVSGHVQGVGFRAFVSELAGRFGASGEVWNERTGGVGVRVYLESQEQLDSFTDSLRRGPGQVRSVNALPDEEGTADPEFRIGPTR